MGSLDVYHGEIRCRPQTGVQRGRLQAATTLPCASDLWCSRDWGFAVFETRRVKLRQCPRGLSVVTLLRTLQQSTVFHKLAPVNEKAICSVAIYCQKMGSIRRARIPCGVGFTTHNTHGDPVLRRCTVECAAHEDVFLACAKQVLLVLILLLEHFVVNKIVRGGATFRWIHDYPNFPTVESV